MSKSRPSLRASSKNAGGKSGKDEEEACPAWVFGIKSVLDVSLSAYGKEPVTPPVALYLEEVLLGMSGGAGDPTTKEVSPGIRRPGTKVSPMHRMQALTSIAMLEPAEEACRSLFWLVLWGIFGHLRPEVVEDFRQRLGKSWFDLTLQGMGKIPGDRDLQDAVYSAMPFVFAQAIYRLFVDGFVEDRTFFVKDGEQMLMKTAQICHFEIVGFQAAAETVRRARHRLFLKRVVRGPHVDQREFMKGRKRQEILEGHSANAAEQPLKFGEMTSVPLEDSQLDHVLHGSGNRRRQQRKALSSGKGVWDLDSTPVPDDLSIERHDGLSTQGHTMYERHMRRLCQILDEEVDDDDFDEDEESASKERSPISSPPASEPHSPLGADIGTLTRSARSFGGPAPLSIDTGDDATSCEVPEPESPLSPSDKPGSAMRNNRRLWRKSLAVAKLTIAKEDQRSRKDREAKAKKARQEKLQYKIVHEPLLKELSQRSLSTTWVSPPMKSLANEQDREVLHKTSAEAFQLKMALPPGLSKTSSMPNLRSPSKADSSRAVTAPIGQSVGSVDATSIFSMRASTAGTGLRRDEEKAGTSLPRVVGGMATAGKVNQTIAPMAPIRGEAIGIEPPTRLGASVMKKRIEAQEKSFQKLSFAIYMKEHDVLTGIKKVTMDSKKLQDEEEMYVKKMQSLVGGGPKRLIAPETILSRQHAERAVASAAAAASGGGSGAGGRDVPIRVS